MNNDPSLLTPESLTIGIASAIGGGVVLFVVERVLDAVRGKSSKADLERTIALLRNENATLQAKLLESESKNAESQRKIAAYAGKDALLEGLAFQVHIGTYLDTATGLHYCPSCMSAMPAARSPMSKRGTGWICHCGKFCDDTEKSAKKRAEAMERLMREDREQERRGW